MTGLVAFAGCQSSPDYTFSGRLLKADGSPASGMSVVVTPASAALTGEPEGTVLTTDEGGGFSGSFANDMDNFGRIRVPLTQMPPLAGVYLWVYDRYSWKPIPVSMDPVAERQRCPGGEQLVLPSVRLPQARDPKAETMPAITTIPS